MNPANHFTFARSPRIIFGAGGRSELGRLAAAFGPTALLVTGRESLSASGHKSEILDALRAADLAVYEYALAGEPSPEVVDQAVREFGPKVIAVVVAVGGGSVLDAGKAISAMLPLGQPVQDYLEGAGVKNHPGVKVPFIAAPTTAGTGAEATKNASLRRLGPDGFKHSLRHENLMPEVALVDPELALTCPRSVTAACGMDALSQLLESYVSPLASPLTDALAWNGLERIRDNLLLACGGGASSLPVRAGMAYAALLSGLALANAGLGVVHSLSSVLGGRCDIPHGVLCGTLLGAGMRVNMEKLIRTEGPASPAVIKHARIGEFFVKRRAESPLVACGWLAEILNDWIRALNLPRLGEFGVTPNLAEEIAAVTPIRNNPVSLTPQEIFAILQARL